MAFDEWVMANARVATRPRKRLGIDDVLAFFQQLATLVAAGTPLLQAIQTGAEQTESLRLRQILHEIAGRLSAGSSLHTAAANYPEAFEYSWIEMIRTGEITGRMSEVLRELSAQVQEAREARRRVRAAMFYPAVLLCVATLAIAAMLRFVVPTFDRMFKEMGAPLPEITQFVVNASRFVVSYGLYIAVGLGLLGFAFQRYFATEDGRRRVLGIVMVLPTAGDLLVQSTMYRFASNIALLLKSGVPMLETLDTLKGVLGFNPIYRDAIEQARRRVAAGQSLASALEESGLFTAMIINMVRTGEESGQLAAVMERVAPYYREKVESLIAKVSKSLEPLIVVGMGAMIAVMMLSIYLPMFNMSGNIR
ncbi:type II secretion system F family protein [Tautonia sociabilis]|uniref:General secretion pathway protein F n=1 Tax=Tautonia sociabilis TaxID=2080755 RepID=A0A432MES6_9BACT|nr:type II secretion system F family protein [Tautonia sociabilis]RUL84180.1 type II secretion system F family protein [Tautonia sociabilis]